MDTANDYSDTQDNEGMAEGLSDTAPDTGDEINMQVCEAAERLGSVPELEQETWQNLDSTQRLDALQSVEYIMADVQGRPPLSVMPVEMDQNTFGQFDGSAIQINSSMLESNDLPASEFIDTVVHEGRHAYQYYAINHPGFESDPALTQSWAENFKPGNYLSAQEYGQELYIKQPVEADAWNYSALVIAGMKRG
jgi:hypothetical protein